MGQDVRCGIDKVCPQCAETFVSWRVGVGKYCSRACSNRARSDESTAATTRVCTRCKRELPLSAYKTSLRPTRIPGKRYYGTRCKDCRVAEYDPAATRDRSLQRRYHMTSAQFEERLKAQGGCAACGSVTTDGKYWHVDHDHGCCPVSARSCGKCIRSILCHGCNTALGNLGESPERIAALLRYAEVHCG